MASQPAVSVGHLSANLGLESRALWSLPHLAPSPPGPPCPGTCLLFALSGGMVVFIWVLGSLRLCTPPGLNSGPLFPQVLEAGAELAFGAVCRVYIPLAELFCQRGAALLRVWVHGERSAKL